MKPVRVLAVLLYNVAKHLPESHASHSLGAGKLRAWCAAHMLQSCGRNVNVERMASFGHDVHLGDRSGIGIRAQIGRGTRIGSDVMMGPDCIIYSVSHRYDRTDIPMIQQGYQPLSPVTIGNDVWIGSRVTSCRA